MPDFLSSPRAVRWALFTCTLSLLPVALTIFFQGLGGKDVDLRPVFEHGDLLLIAIGIGADAIGESAVHDNSRPVRKTISYWLAVVAVIFAASGYAWMLAGLGKYTWKLLWISGGLWLLAVISSGGCILQAEESK